MAYDTGKILTLLANGREILPGMMKSSSSRYEHCSPWRSSRLQHHRWHLSNRLSPSRTTLLHGADATNCLFPDPPASPGRASI